MRRRLCALGLLAGGVMVPVTASAQTASGLDIRIGRDTRPGILASDLVVNLKVTVTDRTTAAPPQDRFEVYASAQPPTGARTEIFPCARERDSSPDVPAGIYLCTVLVDHGGRWQFSGAVNRLRGDPDDPPVVLAGRSPSSTSSPAKSRPPPTRPDQGPAVRSRAAVGPCGVRGGVVAGRCPDRDPRVPGPAAPPVTLRPPSPRGPLRSHGEVVVGRHRAAGGQRPPTCS